MPEGGKPGNVWWEQWDAPRFLPCGASGATECRSYFHMDHSLIQECLCAAEASGPLIWVEHLLLRLPDRMA